MELIISLVTNILLVVATFFGGWMIYKIYKSQKEDFKKNAAGIIISEIRYAERKIAELKDIVNDPIKLREFSNTKVIPQNNWEKNNYLFTQDLDIDELELIKNFYSLCESLDTILPQLSPSIQLERKAQAIYTGLAEIAREVSSTVPLEQQQAIYDLKKNTYLNLINPDPWAFIPQLPIDVVRQTLAKITPITTTSEGKVMK